MNRALRRMMPALTSAAVTAGLLVFAAGPASAHVEEEVGPYHMEVGFLTEPAISGFQNGVFFEVAQASNDSPVTDVGESLKVSVGFGDQSTDLTFEPIPDNPGQYVAPFIPTQPGAYTFVFSGSIKSTPVDVSITSGPDTFDEVQDPASLQFPVKEPSVSDVATKLDRETARVTAAAEAATTQAAAAKQSAQSVQDEASTAKTLGIAGLIIGAVGLVVAIVAVATRRRPAPPAAASPSTGTASQS
jgi:hypothetical protein